MKRQIETPLFERLLLSRGEINKTQILKLAEKEIELSKPLDIIKDPYVFEFLGLPKQKPIMESALVDKIESFYLSLEEALCLWEHNKG